MIKKRATLADYSFSWRNAYRDSDAGIQQRNRKGGNSRDVPAFDHLQWRQFRVAGDDLVIRAMALGELHLVDWFRVVRKELLSGLSLGLILGTIGVFRISLWHTCTFSITGRITGWWPLLLASRWWASCFGERSAARCFRSCCAVADSIRRRHRHHSWPRWSM